MSLSKKIKSIQVESLFSGKYQDGIYKLSKLEKRFDSKDKFLCSYGILYDHLAMKAKGSRKLRLEKTARSYYQEAIDRGVGGLSPYWGLGRILLHNRKYKSGLKYYRKACDMRPDSRSARSAYATALLWTSRNREAKKLFLADRKKYGPSFRSSFNLVGIEKKLGNFPQSKKYALEALRFFLRNNHRKTKFGKVWEDYLKRSLVLGI